ncbi:uncharacterized protein DSM5745_10349 [Aspergillus mulundensis]|uniref:Uncharacterized protein n=1 Tax=Aspergillus mulundensis TaxID=1810919 RepID=A0A3D8QNH6_9EURO|nr:hypothetical protein DSM5745_10349 [Aspergillus mulundensis]RDW63238.1 hypothetical protein DSM5745_10349 [Aspergillus mulundensis]
MASTASSSGTGTVQIVLAYGHQHSHFQASDLEYIIPIIHSRHVMLTLVRQDTTNCDWIHVTNGPEQYERLIEHHRNERDTNAESSEQVGQVPEHDVPQILQIAESIPAQRCQLYAAALLDRLAERGFVERATAQRFRSNIGPCVADQLRAPPVSRTEDAVEFITRHYAFSYEMSDEADMLKDRCFHDQRIEPDPVRVAMLDLMLRDPEFARFMFGLAGYGSDADSARGAGVGGGDAQAGSSRPRTNRRQQDQGPAEQR